MRLSCKRFWHNEVRRQLRALACNLVTFLRCLALPEARADWSLTSLHLTLIRIGARAVRHARAITFQRAVVAVTAAMMRAILFASTGCERRHRARDRDPAPNPTKAARQVRSAHRKTGLPRQQGMAWRLDPTDPGCSHTRARQPGRSVFDPVASSGALPSRRQAIRGMSFTERSPRHRPQGR